MVMVWFKPQCHLIMLWARISLMRFTHFEVAHFFFFLLKFTSLVWEPSERSLPVLGILPPRSPFSKSAEAQLWLKGLIVHSSHTEDSLYAPLSQSTRHTTMQGYMDDKATFICFSNSTLSPTRQHIQRPTCVCASLQFRCLFNRSPARWLLRVHHCSPDITERTQFMKNNTLKVS